MGKKKNPQNICFCPRHGDLELGEDSPCIYTSFPIYNCKENLDQAFCNFLFEVHC
jgi:hypothetical protein